MADHPKVVGIGETGLDYYRLTEPLEWQRERFRTHIRAARATFDRAGVQRAIDELVGPAPRVAAAS
jgi:hypothetical protein